MKVALLEDNPINSEFIQTLLRMEGHEIIPYREGASLLAALHTSEETFPYDVALIDLMLPGTLSGQDVMRRLQQQYPMWHLPFVVVSAASPQELGLVQTDFPQTPILSKPFKRQQLLDAIEKATAISKMACRRESQSRADKSTQLEPASQFQERLQEKI